MTHSTFIETLDEIDYPLTILANEPQADMLFDQDAFLNHLRNTISQNIARVLIIPATTGSWPDTVLDTITDEMGLMLVNLSAVKTETSSDYDFSIAAHYPPEKIAKLRSSIDIGAQLQARCLMMEDLTEPMPKVESSTNNDESALLSDSEVLEEIARLNADHCLFSTDKIAVYFFKGNESPAALRFIGIGRAITFAAIGAGSGLSVDLSAEDNYYDHLMLWDKCSNHLVGAYRIGFTEEIINAHGVDAVYLSSVFDFKQEYYEQLGNAMELSRSFILPSYQKNPQMLDALWKGIGHIAQRKNCFILYGSVTISASFTPLSQAILVDSLDRYHSETAELRSCVSASHAFTAQTKHHELVASAWAKSGINRLNSVIEDIEHQQRSIPPLIRYYISLNAKFLAFQVEKSFNNAIYCLLKVNLNSLPKRYRKRFLSNK